jgi:hypothetical protein
VDNLPGTMVIKRLDFGRPAVAVRLNGPICLVFADRDAPVWMITAAAILAQLAVEHRRSA